jgi:CheY-like chemotaxis protein
VDDDPVSLSVLVKALGRAGIETVTAGDGAQALALLKAKPEAFDVLLLDRVMPNMNGLQLLKRMKGNPKLEHIPVIFQTAANAPEEIAEGLQAGAYYYLTKPLTQRLVLAVVRTAADVCARHRALSAQVEKHGSPLALLVEGTFAFRTLTEGHELANLLARLCPQPARVVAGLSELLINALEHGNLGITYQEKTELLETNRWKAEVQRRQALPDHRDKRVEVRVQRLPGVIRFDIQDQGPGFDWATYVVPSPSRVFDNHGRGIFMAKLDSFDHLEYLGSGNRVVAEVKV